MCVCINISFGDCENKSVMMNFNVMSVYVIYLA